MIKAPFPVQTNPLPISQGLLFALGAVVSFHLAYLLNACAWFMVLFLYCLFRLANLGSGKLAAYFGVAMGLAIYGPYLAFFGKIFGTGAFPLWCVLSAWLAVFLAAGRACLIRFGPRAWAVAAPFLWTGLEYARSELYYLRFSWLNPGYAFTGSAGLHFVAGFGVYGVGFLLMAWAAYAGVFAQLSKNTRLYAGAALAVVSTLPMWLPGPVMPDVSPPDMSSESSDAPDIEPLNLTGVQLEGSSEGQIKSALDSALKKYPQTDLFVLSEYAFQGPVPPPITNWCKTHRKWLAAGGEDRIAGSRYYNSVFVVGPDGAVAFRQAKCVPVQFMKDGAPAREQRVWESPWGKLGFGICYDASYTQVTDQLIRLGAQVLIFPTMDSEDWGGPEHRLHGRIAPMRAAEYQVPVFRLCSSGISQYVGPEGRVIASAPFPGQGDMLRARIDLPLRGRVPPDRPLAQFAVVAAIILILFLIVDYVWRPRPPQ